MENRHNNIEFTILMPCLNEEKTVAGWIGKALKWIEKSGVNGEVLVVDNGSTDNSVKRRCQPEQELSMKAEKATEMP